MNLRRSVLGVAVVLAVASVAGCGDPAAASDTSASPAPSASPVDPNYRTAVSTGMDTVTGDFQAAQDACKGNANSDGSFRGVTTVSTECYNALVQARTDSQSFLSTLNVAVPTDDQVTAYQALKKGMNETVSAMNGIIKGIDDKSSDEVNYGLDNLQTASGDLHAAGYTIAYNV